MTGPGMSGMVAGMEKRIRSQNRVSAPECEMESLSIDMVACWPWIWPLAITCQFSARAAVDANKTALHVHTRRILISAPVTMAFSRHFLRGHHAKGPRAGLLN